MLTAAVLLSCSCIYLGGSDAGCQGSSISDHHKTTVFGFFKLLTRSPLQKGLDPSPPNAFLEESNIWNTHAGILSYI